MGNKYGYNYKNGGMVGFEGVQINQKKISDITAEFSDDDTHLTVTVTYDDENEEQLETDVEDTETDGVKLTEIKEYWNDEIVLGEEENNGSG